jgi:hypothetical protein
MVRNRYFAPYLPYLDGTAILSAYAKVIAILTMWLSISASAAMIWFTAPNPIFLWIVLALAGTIGTVVIARLGRKKGVVPRSRNRNARVST